MVLMKIIIFLKNVLQEIEIFARGNVSRVTIFAQTEGMKKNHNFLFHYHLGGRQPIEDKPINTVKFDENLQRICFKCSFTIINRQPPPRVGLVDILDIRV